MVNSFWSDINIAQATFLSGLLTLFAAIGAVILGHFIFRGKVQDIQSAISQTENKLNQHLEHLEVTVSAVSEKTLDLDRLISSLGTRIGQIQTDIDDDQSDRAREDVATNLGEALEDSSTASVRDELNQVWEEIRSLVEQSAGRPEIDGRTRAKYLRIDRRNFGRLIDAVDEDGNLPAAGTARKANALRMSFRNRRAEPASDHVNEMKEYLTTINNAIYSAHNQNQHA